MKMFMTGLMLISSFAISASTFVFKCNSVLYSDIGLENEYKINFEDSPGRPKDIVATVFQNNHNFQNDIAYTTGNISEKVFGGSRFLITVPISIQRDSSTRAQRTTYKNNNLDGVMLLSNGSNESMEKVKCSITKISE